MKNIYVALAINNSGTIEIKAGSTGKKVKTRMSQFASSKRFEDCSLNQDNIVFEKLVKDHATCEQKAINTVRKLAEHWRSKGFRVKVFNEDSARGNPAPEIKNINIHLGGLLVRAFAEIQKTHVEEWENCQEKIWEANVESQIQASLNRIRVLEQAKANRKLIQEKFKLSLTQA